MKNMKISRKLILSFLIITAFSIVLAGIGIVSTTSINDNYTYLINSPIERQVYLRQMQFDFMTMRYRAANFVMNTGDDEMINGTLLPQYNSAYESFKNNLNAYIQNCKDDKQRDPAVLKKNTDEAASLGQLLEQYKQASDKTLAFSLAGDAKGGDLSLKDVIPLSGEINAIMSAMIEPAVTYVNETSDSMKQTGNTLTVVQIIVTVICVILSMVFAVYISGIISRPLIRMRDLLVRWGEMGDMEVTEEGKRELENDGKTKDEIGQCAASYVNVLHSMWSINDALGKVAGGDLTVAMELLSEKDSMGLSINKMVDSLNSMFGELKMASDQVSSGSGQVSQGAQELASASSEQAASVEELSATIAEVRVQVDENSKRSEKALENCDTSGKLMETSMESMKQMLGAMQGIDESSKNITRVIKVIDDIAFQTNILALNAAVEAARAGQHGKGFAVVADEVRNLASKSAAAAKETANLIEGSTQRVSEGSMIVERTNESLTAVVATTTENAELIRDMAKSLEKQATSVIEINQGMDQISTVVQANAATSEQSAAAAEQMSAQAVVMNEIVSRFKLRQSGNNNAGALQQSGFGTHNEPSGFSLTGGDKY